MGKASRDKGKVGERAWAAFLRDVGGFDDARRGVQYSGLGNAPDCVVPCLGETFWCEVKRINRGTQIVYDWMDQATRDSCVGQIPYVAHRKDNCRWLVTLNADDWMKIMRDYVENV
jgi:hypothetical protein